MAPRATWKTSVIECAGLGLVLILSILDRAWSSCDTRGYPNIRLEASIQDLFFIAWLLPTLVAVAELPQAPLPGNPLFTSLLRSLVGVCCWSSTPLWTGIRLSHFGRHWLQVGKESPNNGMGKVTQDPTYWLEYVKRVRFQYERTEPKKRSLWGRWACQPPDR